MTEVALAEVDLKVLSYLYGLPPNAGEEARLNNVLQAVFGSNDDDSAEIVFALIQRRLVSSDGTFAHALSLTVDGCRVVERLHALQQDRGHRRRLCREDLLRWVDQNTEPDGSAQVSIADFAGTLDLVSYVGAEVRSAATFLRTNGLIESISTLAGDHLAMWITEKGRDCVDDGGIGQRAEALSQTIVVNGSSNNVVAITGDHNGVDFQD